MMKKISYFLLIITLVLLCSCGQGVNNQKIERAVNIKALNDSIDNDITDLISLYRNSNSALDDIKLASETITKIGDNVEKLEKELNAFNSEYNDELAYDTAMFEHYAEIITYLKKWRDDLIDYYGYNSGLAKTNRISYNSDHAIIIGNKKQLIQEEKPDYQLIIDKR